MDKEDIRLIVVEGNFIPLEGLRKTPYPGVSLGPVCEYSNHPHHWHMVIMATSSERMWAFIKGEGLTSYAPYQQIAPVRPAPPLLRLPAGN